MLEARANLHRAIAHALSRRSGQPLGTRDVQHIHALLNQGDASARPGTWRSATGAVRMDGVSGVRYPAPTQVGQRLAGGVLERALREASRPGLDRAAAVQSAARVYTEIVRTHYLENGNGRTGRILPDMVLMRQGLPPATLVQRNDLMLDLTRPETQATRHAAEAIRQGVVNSEARLARGGVRPLAALTSTAGRIRSAVRGGILATAVGLIPAVIQWAASPESSDGTRTFMKSALPLLLAVAAGVAFSPLGLLASTVASIVAGEAMGLGDRSPREILGGILAGSTAALLLKGMLMASLPYAIGASLLIAGAMAVGRVLARPGGIDGKRPTVLGVPMTHDGLTPRSSTG